MLIALLCATERGRRFLNKLFELSPQSEIVVFSFREESWEPPFLDDIRRLAAVRGALFHEARDVGGASLREFWERWPVDLLLAVNWRYLVPPAVYRRPRLGSFVFHDSLLPEYRGFSPTVWAMINGEDHTGVTLFEMSERADAGDIVDQRRVPIDVDDTIAEVTERVTHAYLGLLEQNLPVLLAGSAPRKPQDAARATFACKRMPDDNEIDWSAPTARVRDLIRAVTRPYPGAFTYLRGHRLRVWAAEMPRDERRYVGRIAGRVVQIRPGEGVVVLTGDGSLLIKEVQLDGGDAVRAADVITSVGENLGR